MTPAARQKLKEKRLARKARERVRIEKRKAKRATKALPKNQLADWSRQVKVVVDNKCEVCGRGEKECTLNSHHILPKERYPEFKFNIINGVCVCFLHHKGGKFSFHRNPIWAVAWLRKHRPETYEWAKANLGIDPTTKETI